MKQTKLTHHFDVIKKEPVCIDERIPLVILEHIDIKQEYHCKEELDVPWDEGDNDFNNISYEMDHSLRTKETENIKRVKKTNEPSDFYESFSDDQNKNAFGTSGYNQLYQRFCPNCTKIEPDDAKVKTRTCQSCDKKWNYECKTCSRKVSTYPGIIIHLRSKHVKKGYYLACLKCNYKSVSRNCLRNHLQKVHFTSHFLKYIKKFESDDVQNDLKSTSRTKNIQKHFNADFDNISSADQNKNACGTSDYRQHYRKICPKCNIIQPIDAKKKKAMCENCNEKWKYECKICSRKIATPQSIRKHLKRMCLKKGSYFGCVKCNFKSVSKYLVRNHLQKIHSILRSEEYIKKFESEDVQNDMISTVKHKCSKCEKQFQTLAHLLKHVQGCGQTKEKPNSDTYKERKSIRDNIIYHCVKCNAVKDAKVGSLYNEKCQNCDSKFSLKCKVCNRIFHSMQGLSVHFKTNHTVSKEVFKCPECDYETNVINYLTKHVRHKHVMETHECPKCGGKYKNRSLYKIHALLCKKAPEFQCDHCPFKTKKKIYLKDHIHRAHFKDKRVDSAHKDLYFNCDDCTYKSRFKRDIIRHVGIHLEDNIKVCPVCKKRFTAHYLKQHVICCGKEFSRCKLCDYQAPIKGAMRRHMSKVHSKGQERECPKCHRTWKYNGYLKAHLKRCGIKFHLQCDDCPFKAKYKTVLREHIVKTHLKSKKRRSKEDIEETHLKLKKRRIAKD